MVAIKVIEMDRALKKGSDAKVNKQKKKKLKTKIKKSILTYVFKLLKKILERNRDIEKFESWTYCKVFCCVCARRQVLHRNRIHFWWNFATTYDGNFAITTRSQQPYCFQNNSIFIQLFVIVCWFIFINHCLCF